MISTPFFNISINPIDSQAFDTEMQSFFDLFTRYLAEKAKSQDLFVYFPFIFDAILMSLSSPETGRKSSHQRQTKSYPTTSCRHPPILNP